ncbi:hypothetical protein WMW72_29215 [Paenibacillus filicis]|uniref:Uncharacterized protein n=1 Tax=Paenibacillus filicis TaxID=669464 RepID=A0ABU9DSY8_9BACL
MKYAKEGDGGIPALLFVVRRLGMPALLVLATIARAVFFVLPIAKLAYLSIQDTAGFTLSHYGPGYVLRKIPVIWSGRRSEDGIWEISSPLQF